MIAVCLNCVSICHEDHLLGPVSREPFYCRCFENDVHLCRASRAAQIHIHRRRAVDAKFKALHQQVFRPPPPVPGVSRKPFSEKKYVVWYRTDDQPKAIVKVFDDIDDANDCVKESFVNFNPWAFSSLTLRSLETFQCNYSTVGLAHYSVSLRVPSESAPSSSSAPTALAKVDQTASATSTTSAALAGSFLVTEESAIEKGIQWEVRAEGLEGFLQDYGCEMPPVLPAITPSTHQLVQWYDFPEPDPFEESALNQRLTQAQTKGNGKKKTSADTLMHENVTLPLKKGGNKRVVDSPPEIMSSSSGKKKGGKKTAFKTSANLDDDFDYEDFIVPVSKKRGRPSAAAAAAIQQHQQPPSGRKTRAPKEEGAPKGPSASFMFYTNAQRSAVRAAHPQLSVTDVTRFIGEAWRKMTPEEKAPYEELARQDRSRYAREKAEFLESKRSQGVDGELASQGGVDSLSQEALDEAEVLAVGEDEDEVPAQDLSVAEADVVDRHGLEEGEESDAFALDDDEDDDDEDDGEEEEEDGGADHDGVNGEDGDDAAGENDRDHVNGMVDETFETPQPAAKKRRVQATTGATAASSVAEVSA